MIQIAIVGGKLQGVEAVYLAGKAGFRTLVIDKKEMVPAKDLCHEFLHADVTKKEAYLIEALKQADMILPALEDDEALAALTEIANEHGLVLAFDPDAYGISKSKIRSDALFHQHNIPAPAYYPDCKAPYIAKPSGLSGSTGVRRIGTRKELEEFLEKAPQDEKWVIQEYLGGRAYSMEVIGKPGNYRTYQITELFMDESYDCKRVIAPCSISDSLNEQFVDITVRLAEFLSLRGIMDVEVIEDEGLLKVLEIDARIPSQTPTAVYHASGMNLVEELSDVFLKGTFNNEYGLIKKNVAYEHYLINDGQIRVLGEHIMGSAGPLKLIPGFCGADEVLTDYKIGSACWRGTFIMTADTEYELNEKRQRVLLGISGMQGEKLDFIDLDPSRGQTP